MSDLEPDDDIALLSKIRTGEWLDQQTFPPLSWAVPGLIPEGFGLLTGPPKAGKSWLTLGVVLAVAAGGCALGKLAVGRPRPTLLLALEDGHRRLQSRCRRLLNGAPIPAQLDYITEATPSQVLLLVGAWLGKHPGERPLVVLDTLGRVMPPTLPGESAYQRDYRVGARLKSLVDPHPGAALVVVHHTRKAAGEDWMDSTSGTNGLNGAADFTVSLSRPRNEAEGVLKVTGRDVPEGEYALTTQDGTWTLRGESLAAAAKAAEQAKAVAGLGERSAEIVALVADHPNGIGPTEVATALGMEAKSAGVYLARLADAGRIAKAGRGSYVPPVESVESVETEHPNTTLSTVSTPITRACAVCRLLMDEALVGAGFTTHPTCESEAA